MTPGRALGAVALSLAIGLAANVAGAVDEITLTSGSTVRGHATIRGDEVHVNLFGSTAADMTVDVVTYARADVRSIARWPIQDALVEGLDGAAEDDVPRRVELLRLAREARAKAFVERIALEVLARSPGHPDALRALGARAPDARAIAADGRLSPQLRRGLRLALRGRDASARRTSVEALARDTGWTVDPLFVERCARVPVAERGVHLDRIARLPESPEDRGTYSLFVPERLDPIDPRPLVVALHGGGTDPSDPSAVRGSGREVLPVLVAEARARGFLLLCPTALEWPWTTARNGAWIVDAIEEVATRWHVDLDRVHLVGMADGGAGAWHHGARDPDRWASVGAASAPRLTPSSTLASKGLRLWLYQGERDEIVPVEETRAFAERLRKQRADFVYCELPREGHGFPPAAIADWARAMAPRRRPRAESAFPRSSFLRPLDERERVVDGDPAAAWDPSAFERLEPEALFDLVASGRAESEVAAHALIPYGEGDAGAPWRDRVRDLVARGEAPVEALRAAYALLGAWRDDGARDLLGRDLRVRNESRLVEAAAEALARLGPGPSTQDLRFALRALERRWKGVGTGQVPYAAYVAHAGAARALVEAIGRSRAEVDLLPEVEAIVVIGTLRDARGVATDPNMGEDVAPIRLLLLDALARTYRALDGPPTLTDMLRRVAGRDAAERAAISRGAAEGWR